jgi:enamine deaminase RidA (YjgF/YER057c/UK114 family)
MLQGAAPASTLLFVAGLANPDWLIEIEAVAAAE